MKERPSWSDIARYFAAAISGIVIYQIGFTNGWQTRRPWIEREYAKEAERIVMDANCAGCGQRKRSGLTVCKTCWKKLPRALRLSLSAKYKTRFLAALAPALDWLHENYARPIVKISVPDDIGIREIREERTA
jgi:hypothetical protein